jgi:acetoacetyl-CoA synthetase
VRFGSAEIYQVIESCFSEGTPSLAKEHTIIDSLCIGQKIEADERVLLFVKLLPGIEISDDLRARIAKEIRIARSARHVPALVSGTTHGEWHLSCVLNFVGSVCKWKIFRIR